MWRFFSLCLLFPVLYGCATVSSGPDYRAYREHLPRSLLVIPPLNDSTDVNAPYVFLSTITRPLADIGYYVFPVAVVDNYFKENGLPTPDEMNTVPLDKLGQVFGADAVLYAHINEWGQKFLLLESATVVSVSCRLVDVKSGATIWEGTARARESTGRGQGHNLAALLVTAAVDQIVASVTARVRDLAGDANQRMIFDSYDGLLHGPYSSEYAADRRGKPDPKAGAQTMPATENTRTPTASSESGETGDGGAKPP